MKVANFMKKRQTILFWMMGYTLFLLLVGSNLPSPLYSEYQKMFGFSSTVLTLIFAVYAFVLIPSLWFFGQLSDRIGRKNILVAGTLITVMGSVVFSMAEGTSWLFVARGLQGLAAGMLSGTATAALVELHPTNNRKFASLVATVATAVGTAIGPLLSGVLAQYSSASVTLPFITHIVLFIPALVALFMMPETVERVPLKNWRLQLPTVPSHIRFLFMIGAMTAFITWSVSAFYTSLIPSYVSNLMGIHNLALTGGIVFLMLLISAFTQLFLNRLSFSQSMISGLLSLILGLSGIVIAVPIQSILLLLLSTVIIGLGWGLAYMGSVALVNEIAPPNQRGHVVSSFYVIVYLGVGFPIIGIGFGTELLGLYKSVLIYVSAAIVLAVIIIVLIRTKLKQKLKLIKNKHYPS